MSEEVRKNVPASDADVYGAQAAFVTPLIWTSKGNLPIEFLTYRHEWTVNDEEIIFVEEYRLGDELVKRSAHVYKKKGVAAQSAIGKIGG